MFYFILLYFIILRGFIGREKEKCLDSTSQLDFNEFDKEGFKTVLFKLPHPITYSKRYI